MLQENAPKPEVRRKHAETHHQNDIRMCSLFARPTSLILSWLSTLTATACSKATGTSRDVSTKSRHIDSVQTLCWYEPSMAMAGLHEANTAAGCQS